MFVFANLFYMPESPARLCHVPGQYLPSRPQACDIHVGIVFLTKCLAGSATLQICGSRGLLLRPWQLGFRSDFGFAGVQEPDDAERLMELILTETFLVPIPRPLLACLLHSYSGCCRFRTDSDLPGVEKLAVVPPSPALLERPWKPMDAFEDEYRLWSAT